jgi:hypothetical protein
MVAFGLEATLLNAMATAHDSKPPKDSPTKMTSLGEFTYEFVASLTNFTTELTKSANDSCTLLLSIVIRHSSKVEDSSSN